jgi:hypothetical protein
MRKKLLLPENLIVLTWQLPALHVHQNSNDPTATTYDGIENWVTDALIDCVHPPTPTTTPTSQSVGVTSPILSLLFVGLHCYRAILFYLLSATLTMSHQSEYTAYQAFTKTPRHPSPSFFVNVQDPDG